MKTHEQIKFFRKLKGWSQEEVANKLEMSLNGYGGIERGDAEITLSRLEQITQIFGINLIDLVGLNEKSILNFTYEAKKTTWIQDESPADYQQLQFELEKHLLLNAEKDKEIAYLKKIIELMELENDNLKQKNRASS